MIWETDGIRLTLLQFSFEGAVEDGAKQIVQLGGGFGLPADFHFLKSTAIPMCEVVPSRFHNCQIFVPQRAHSHDPQPWFVRS